jgi:cytidyltransferase-like protein
MEVTTSSPGVKTSVFDTDHRGFDSLLVERRSTFLRDVASYDLVPSVSPKKMTETLRKSGRKIVCVSGGYDPLHVGHIKQICDAKKLGSLLIVILNSDRFLLNKKGYYFFSVIQRKAILEHLRPIDYVYVFNPTDPDDMTVCEALRDIHPDIFAKGGDRSPIGTPIPEEKLCEELGIEVVYGVGGFDKVSSSSVLVEEAFKRFENRRRK